uniref:Uncharacterized protein n=1 Tax=Physcomitrium patens TaxID=3218 RepID=A0A2K1KHC2_PHYPA|nr:hypothetical protein PHYPA_009557 [Physcomitrium patens]
MVYGSRSLVPENPLILTHPSDTCTAGCYRSSKTKDILRNVRPVTYEGRKAYLRARVGLLV